MKIKKERTLKRGRIITLFTAVVLFAGCFKEVSYRTDYVLKPLVQENSGDVAQLLPEGKAQAFAHAANNGLLGGRFLRRRPGRDHYAAGQPDRKTDRAARDGRTLPAGRDCRMALDADRQTVGNGRRGRYRAQDLRLYPAGDRREFPQALRFRRLQAVEGGDGIQGR